MIEFTVHGIPAPQGSKTAWGTEANPNTRPWRAAVAAQAAETMGETPLLEGPRDPEQEIRVRAPTTLVRTCPVCGRPMWQKHAEVCTGTPVQRIADPPERDAGHECGCNAGGMHAPDCPHVTGDWDEAA